MKRLRIPAILILSIAFVVVASGSAQAGGFWENVAAVTIVDGKGEVHRLGRMAPLFPWLFGSMGQLGIVVEAVLDGVSPPVPKLHGATPASVFEHDRGRLFWFTLFVSQSKLPYALELLEALEDRYSDAFSLRNRYTYYIAHRQVAAPLIWPEAAPFFAVGSWGRLTERTDGHLRRLSAYESAFMDLAMTHGFRRYVQSELPSGPAFYRRYFGTALYAFFRILKQAHDPHDLLNRGWVFERLSGNGERAGCA